MKQLVVFLFLFASSPSFAEQLDNTSIMNLARETAEVVISISYPGDTVSGVCAFDIVADSWGRGVPIQNLLGVLDFRFAGDPDQIRPVEVISDKTLRIKLLEDLFTDGIIIRSNDGSSLAETIRRALGENRRVVILPRSC